MAALRAGATRMPELATPMLVVTQAGAARAIKVASTTTPTKTTTMGGQVGAEVADLVAAALTAAEEEVLEVTVARAINASDAARKATSQESVRISRNLEAVVVAAVELASIASRTVTYREIVRILQPMTPRAEEVVAEAAPVVQEMQSPATSANRRVTCLATAPTRVQVATSHTRGRGEMMTEVPTADLEETTTLLISGETITTTLPRLIREVKTGASLLVFLVLAKANPTLGEPTRMHRRHLANKSAGATTPKTLVAVAATGTESPLYKYRICS